MLRTNRIQELDALRGIAALLVVLFHYTMNRQEATLGFKLGTTGVDLFFMISGFVILMSLAKIDTAKRFVINRLSRLYPSYWAAVTITYLLSVYINSIESSLWLQDYEVFDYLANLTMFQLYLGIPDIDGPYWTMVLEMLFYLLMLVIFLTKKLNQFHIIGALLISLVAIANFFWGSNRFVIDIFENIPLLPFLPLFYAGTLFYRLYTEPKMKYLIILLLLSYIIQIYFFHIAGRSYHFISQFEYGIMITIYYSLFFLFINGRLKFIVHPITLFFGGISYALYLIHQSVSIYIIIPFFTLHYNMSFWVAALFIALPVSILLAYLITRFIEKPFGKWLKKTLTTRLLANNSSIKFSLALIVLPILLFVSLLASNPNEESIIITGTRGDEPEFVTQEEYKNKTSDAFLKMRLPNNSENIIGWENINYNDSLQFVITSHSELYGVTFKTKKMSALNMRDNQLLIHSRIKQQCKDAKSIYLVISLKQSIEDLLLYQVINVSERLTNDEWNEFYISTELPFVNSEEYEFVIHIYNSEECDIAISEFDFIITNAVE